MTGETRRRTNPRGPRRSGVRQAPFGQRARPYAPIRVLSDDQVEAIHLAALDLVATQGLRVLDARARSCYASAGATVTPDMMVRLDPDLVMDLLSHAPASFPIVARNPAFDLQVGGNACIYASVGGPAYVMDNDRGRRDGTYEDLCDYLKLVQVVNVIHQEGGCPFEPMDRPAATRHLDIYMAQITTMDKSWQTQTLGHARTMDGIEMAAISRGITTEALKDSPMLVGVINTNSPLQLDIPMAEGLIAMASHKQVLAITPFTLAGAMAPITLAGALVQQHAEAMAVLALTQIVQPGAPVLYGGFTSNVDMRSGAPAFGTPEYTKAAQASGQLARRIGIPFRSSNTTAANEVDAQASYESTMSLWGALMGGAHLLEHGAGWMHGGLTASFEKLILDAELLQMMDAYFDPIDTSPTALGLEAIREAGPGGHFFGTAQTMERYETAFYTPLLSNWDNYPNWLDHGAVDARTRANTIWKELLHTYEPPVLDPAVIEALDDYIARRKAEGGAPMN